MVINEVIQGYCEVQLSKFPDNCIDLTLTSPPYDRLRNYGGKYYYFNDKDLINQLYRVTKKGGIVVWVVGDQTIKGSESGTSFKQALLFMEAGFRLHDTMIFEKHNFGNPSSNRYHQMFEYMFVFSKGKPKTFNPIKDKVNKYAGSTTYGKNTVTQVDGSKKQRAKKIYSEFGMRGNIWKYIVGNANGDDKGDHPAPFPEKLAEDHILSWSKKGDLVLDCFAGSGTTLKMAKKLNRNYIGIELNGQYISKIIKPRLNNELKRSIK